MADVSHAEPRPVDRRMPRWAKFALVGSLALNVLFIGAMIGAVLRGPHASAGRGSNNIIAYVATLPVEERQKLMAQMKDMRQQVRPLRQAAREAARERAASLVAEPFDKQSYLAAQTRQIEAETKLRLLMRDLVADAAASMTGEQRKAFVRWRGPRQMPPLYDDDGSEPAGKGGKR